MSKASESPRTRNIKPKSDKPPESSSKATVMPPGGSRHLSSDATPVAKVPLKVEEDGKAPRSPPLLMSGQFRRGSGLAVNSSGAGVSTSIDMGLAVSNHMLSISVEKSAISVAAACARGFVTWLPAQVIRVIGFERESGASDRLFLLASCGENCVSPLTTNSDKLSEPLGLPKTGLSYRAARSGLSIRSTCDSSDISIPVDVGETFSPISGQIIVAPCLFNGSCVAVLTATGASFSDAEYLMFQQIAKITGVSIGNSVIHQQASFSSRQCSLIQRASAILLRSRDI